MRCFAKAKAGHVIGGRVFGYDNVRAEGRVGRRINYREASVVRRIFELAQSAMVRVIAHTLNDEGHAARRAQRGRPAGWAPSTVREILTRPLYRGVIEWDRFRRSNERPQLKRHENHDPLRIEAPALGHRA